MANDINRLIDMLFERIEQPEKNKEPVGLKMSARLVVRKSTVADTSEEWIFVDW